MPIPKPSEEKKDFIDRCIPIVLGDGAAETPEQAVAICNSLWEESTEYSYKGAFFNSYQGVFSK